MPTLLSNRIHPHTAVVTSTRPPARLSGPRTNHSTACWQYQPCAHVNLALPRGGNAPTQPHRIHACASDVFAVHRPLSAIFRPVATFVVLILSLFRGCLKKTCVLATSAGVVQPEASVAIGDRDGGPRARDHQEPWRTLPVRTYVTAYCCTHASCPVSWLRFDGGGAESRSFRSAMQQDC